jgi:hypothetical protein
MEPVSTLILGALAAGAADGLKGAAGQAVADAYAGLKSLIIGRCGADSPAATALVKLEDTPDSPRRRQELIDALSQTAIDNDPAIVTAARQLQASLSLHRDERRVTVIGDGAVVGGDGATITVTNTFTRS